VTFAEHVFSIAAALLLAAPGHSTHGAESQRASHAARLRLHEFHSDVFGNTRTLRVLVPAGYDDSGNASRRYPVLYLNDGQNLFDAATSMFGRVEWQVDETVDRLVAAGRIEPVIVVGIDNAGKRKRPDEYLPFPDEYLTPPVPAPHGRLYPDFLVGEVMPFIDRTYRTRTGAESTGLGGSSYGAVAALYTVMQRPGVFGKLLLESPSLYIQNNRLLKDAGNVQRWPGRVYLGIGTRETGDAAGDREAVGLVESLGKRLSNAGLTRQRLLVVVGKGARHGEDAWARRLPGAMEFFYRARGRKGGPKKGGVAN
jgi:predicted alpha/beta superfamily hydrolase